MFVSFATEVFKSALLNVGRFIFVLTEKQSLINALVFRGSDMVYIKFVNIILLKEFKSKKLW